MSVEYSSIICKTALSPSKLPGLRYSLNPYRGCEHGCVYCYSPSVIGDREFAMNWGKVVHPKQNIVEVLTREVKRKPKGVVGVSTVCDPYQQLEAKLELTRRCIELLSRYGFDVSIQTKSSLVLRDVDIIKPHGFEVGATITTMDRELAGKLEPGASPPDARAHVLEEFASRGVETWLFFGPIIPEINDSAESIKKVIEMAKRTNTKIIYDKLNLRRWVLDRLAPVLERERLGLTKRLPALTGKKLGWWLRTCSLIESICRGLEVKCEPAFPSWPSAL